MNEVEIKNQIKQLENEYRDLRSAINSLTSNLNNSAILRGALSGAGVSAESILKCIIRIEKINVKTNDPKIPTERLDEIRKKEVQGLMLDEMIRLVETKIPLRILTNLRTIQAWRNIGSHDKGEQTINETVNSGSLQIVSVALNELVTWFVGDYLKEDLVNFMPDENNPASSVSGVVQVEEWRECYWYAMKDGEVSKFEQNQLNFLAKKHKLSDSDISNLQSEFNRNADDFREQAFEIFNLGELSASDLELLEFTRENCCISKKEAIELISEFTKSEIFLPEENSIEWVEKINFLRKKGATTETENSADQTSLITPALPVNDRATEDDSTATEIVLDKITEDDKLEIFHDTDCADYLVKLKPKFLKRLDFCFFICHEFIEIHSETNKILISQNGADNWLNPSGIDKRYLNGGTGFNSIKIAVPDSNNNFLPDWKKNIVAEEDDQDILLLIERYPAELSEFGLKFSIGKYIKKFRLKFGTYYFNSIK